MLFFCCCFVDDDALLLLSFLLFCYLREKMVFIGIGLSVRLSVSKIAQKVVDGFR